MSTANEQWSHFHEAFTYYFERWGEGFSVLNRLTGIPRDTLRNWKSGDGRPSRPDAWSNILRVAEVMSLSPNETNTLLRLAGHRALNDLQLDVPDEIKKLIDKINNRQPKEKESTEPQQRPLNTSETNQHLKEIRAGVAVSINQNEHIDNKLTTIAQEIGARRVVPDLEKAIAKLNELPLDQVPVIGTLPTGSRVLFSPNPLFVGRQEELIELATMFKGNNIKIARQIVAITGMGGVGKTQLSVAFVHHYGHYFQGGVFWITMSDPSDIPQQIVECGENMAELRADYHQLEFMTRVRLVLSAWQSEVPRLLVFDNCESSSLLAEWMPKTGGSRVLITSRRSQFDIALGVKSLSLQTLIRLQSIELLSKFPVSANTSPYKINDTPHFDAISAELGDLPLALHLAGSFLLRYRRAISPATYLAQLQNHSLKHHSLQSQEVSPTAHDQHVARTFALSYEQLKVDSSIDALALRLIAQIACFAPGELIPSELLIATVGLYSFFQADTAENGVYWLMLSMSPELKVEEALYRLTELGLVEIAPDGKVILHRLLAQFVQQVDQEGLAEAENIVDLTLINQAKRLTKENSFQQLSTWQIHLRYRTDLAKTRLDKTSAELCNALGAHLYAIGNYAAALPYWERTLAITEIVFGSQHSETVGILNNLGVLLNAMGEYEKSKPFFEKALSINLGLHGDLHPLTAQISNNLGRTLQSLGDHKVAEDHLEHSVKINESVKIAQPLDTAHIYMTRGQLSKQNKDYESAKHWYIQALNIRLEMLGDHHPETAETISNLGYLLYEMKQYEEALTHAEKASAIHKAIFGEQHPTTAKGINNIGYVLTAMGEHESARAYFEQALIIRQATLGTQHPETIRNLNNLGELLIRIGEYAAALPYLEQTLTIRQTLLGDQHPDTIESLCNVGNVLYKLGEFARAKYYAEQMLVIHKTVFSDEHIYTSQGILNMGKLLYKMGEFVEARPYFELALTFFENHLGAQHPFTEYIRTELDLLIAELDRSG